MEERAIEKKAFFDELYALDDEDSDFEDKNDAAIFLRNSKPTLPSAGVSLLPTPRQLIQSSPFIGRTLSAPIPQAITPALKDVEVIEDTPLPSATSAESLTKQQRIAPPRLPVSNDHRGGNAPKPSAKLSKKRKPDQPLEILPESQQIFKGLAFYFFPDDDIAPARRDRIRKALERGAVWVKEWRAGITHVIFERHLCYADLLKYVKITSVPDDVVLVNDNYPAECIGYRSMLNPEQWHFRVKGLQEALNPAEPSTIDTPSQTSLPLKPAKGEFVRSQQTPSRTDGSDRSSVLNQELLSMERSRAQANAARVATTVPYPRSALDEAIEEARAVEGLPMESDNSEDFTESNVSADSEDGHSDEEPKKKKAKRTFEKSWQQSNFTCMHKHDGPDKLENPNARTIEVLQKMADYYGRTRDQWRTLAYRKAIAALRKQNRKVTTKEEAIQIPFIGKRLADKIEEIVWTNRLRRLENLALEPNDEVLQKFLNIYGVGYAQATKWISQGHRTLEDLSEKASLTTNQKIGISHFDDFQTRIPRKEVERHVKLVREAMHRLDEGIEVTVGGSFRRGAADCGDIDFIVTKPDCSMASLRTLILDSAIPRLFFGGYLKVGLATTSREDGSKWHGAACLPGTSIWRRVDFLLVPSDEMGAALIYFTGNDIFNRSIRLLASKKGMRLNQRGLWRDVMRGRNREKVTQGSLVESKSEKKIFEILGVPWRPPEHRIC